MTLADRPVLSRRNPTVKLGVLVLVSLVVTFVWDPVTPALLYTLAVVAVLRTARVSSRALAVGQVPFLLFGVGLLIVNALSRPGTVLWEPGPLRITAEGLDVGLALAVRTLLIGVLVLGFLVSTDPVELVTSLHQQARLPARLAYALLAGYLMLQQMPREWETIRHAHTVRTAGVDGQARNGPRALARSAFTLLVVSVRKGERVAQALESRGLGLEPRTVWRPVRVDRGDAWLVGAVLATTVAVLVFSAALGVLAGPGALS